MPPIIAYFDMDYTILDASSSILYVNYLRRTGQISRHQILRVSWWALLYKLSIINMVKAMPRMLTYAQDASAHETFRQAYAWFAEAVIDHISPRAVERIKQHQTQQHRVVVISASTQFAVRPVAEALELDYLCTQLEIKNDRITGSIIEPACYGAGKIYWARQYADQHQARLCDAYFYTDSFTDKPLLELVGQPTAVNPDPRLKRLAKQRNWPVLAFH
jgi:HAD superfamily hydrolase (TIGR01490 family)